VEVAELLGRHKSWVCRRLALIERLGSKARDELARGLLTPTAARQIVRLPEGNQTEVLESHPARGAIERGTGRRGGPVVKVRRTSPAEYLLAHPREALSQAKGSAPRSARPAAERSRNQVWKRVGLLLDVLGRMEVGGWRTMGAQG